MNIARLRHRAANILLRLTCGFGTRVARFICGPLNTETLYVEAVLEQSLVRSKNLRRRAHPGVSSIDEPGTPHEENEFERWLQRES